jgi:putative ribosome biogenesis GTPase RsgA
MDRQEYKQAMYATLCGASPFRDYNEEVRQQLQNNTKERENTMHIYSEPTPRNQQVYKYYVLRVNKTGNIDRTLMLTTAGFAFHHEAEREAKKYTKQFGYTTVVVKALTSVEKKEITKTEVVSEAV